MRARRNLLAAVAALSASATPALAQPLVADLSSHLITITSSYSGTELLLFGSLDQRGDVVVVVRGPEQAIVVRRKERQAGIWVNGAAVTFEQVPGFYAVAATRPLASFATPSLLARLGIGHDTLRLRTAGELPPSELAAFRQALVRNLGESGLYPAETGKVTLLGSSLFRTEISFPANVPTGNYLAQVYLFRDNDLVTAQTTPLFVRKSGIERTVFEYAHREPFLYGIATVLLAMVAGWLAEAAFRRR